MIKGEKIMLPCNSTLCQTKRSTHKGIIQKDFKKGGRSYVLSKVWFYTQGIQQCNSILLSLWNQFSPFVQCFKNSVLKPWPDSALGFAWGPTALEGRHASNFAFWLGRFTPAQWAVLSLKEMDKSGLGTILPLLGLHPKAITYWMNIVWQSGWKGFLVCY